jgi:hypothetical protein
MALDALEYTENNSRIFATRVGHQNMTLELFSVYSSESSAMSLQTAIDVCPACAAEGNDSRDLNACAPHRDDDDAGARRDA